MENNQKPAGTSVSISNIEAATNATVKLLNSLESLLNITNASDYGTEINKKPEQLVKHLIPIVNQAKKGILSEINMTALVKEVNSLATLILRTKAKNPLISQELVNRASESAQEADLALTLTKKALDHKTEIEREDQQVLGDSDPKAPSPESVKESKKGCMPQMLFVLTLILVSLFFYY